MTEPMTEIWKAIPGYEGRFEVSNTGQVKSLAHQTTFEGRWGIQTTQYKETILAPSITKNNRVSVHSEHNGERVIIHVARLVAATFIPNPEMKPEVNHIDGNPLNNDVSNLEWVTKSENHEHRVQVLGKGAGETHGMAKLNREQVREIFLDPDFGPAVAAKYGISATVVKNIRLRKNWQAATADLEDVPRRKARFKLAEDDVVEIRRLLMQGKTNREIAESFSVDPAVISNIRNNKRRAA